ncbi:MAG: LytTR family DNA-binding domain-containing protein [Saprospiraceae bacterium]
MTHRLAIPQIKGNITIRKIEDIVYFQADESICLVNLINGEKLISTLPLNHYTNLLEEDYNFFSISRSLLINLKYLSDYNNVDLEIKLSNDFTLSLSRRGAKKLRDFLFENTLLTDIKDDIK